jgi:hypothetical protein
MIRMPQCFYITECLYTSTITQVLTGLTDVNIASSSTIHPAITLLLLSATLSLYSDKSNYYIAALLT